MTDPFRADETYCVVGTIPGRAGGGGGREGGSPDFK